MLSHRTFLSVVRSLGVLALSASIVGAATITLDFEAVPVSGPGVFADPTAYLASFGITASNATPGALFGVTVSDAAVPSTKHVLNEYNGSSPETFTLNFLEPVSSLSFVREQYGSNNSGPAWSASALDASGDVIGTVSEGVQFASLSATYLFPLSGISGLRFDANNTGQTWSGPPIGSLTFTSAVPEPSTILLISLIGALYLAARLIRLRPPIAKTRSIGSRSCS